MPLGMLEGTTRLGAGHAKLAWGLNRMQEGAVCVDAVWVKLAQNSTRTSWRCRVCIVAGWVLAGALESARDLRVDEGAAFTMRAVGEVLAWLGGMVIGTGLSSTAIGIEGTLGGKLTGGAHLIVIGFLLLNQIKLHLVGILQFKAGNRRASSTMSPSNKLTCILHLDLDGSILLADEAS
jgi:hypothetical protein